jgi:hypothetical protein
MKKFIINCVNRSILITVRLFILAFLSLLVPKIHQDHVFSHRERPTYLPSSGHHLVQDTNTNVTMEFSRASHLELCKRDFSRFSYCGSVVYNGLPLHSVRILFPEVGNRISLETDFE